MTSDAAPPPEPEEEPATDNQSITSNDIAQALAATANSLLIVSAAFSSMLTQQWLGYADNPNNYPRRRVWAAFGGHPGLAQFVATVAYAICRVFAESGMAFHGIDDQFARNAEAVAVHLCEHAWDTHETPDVDLISTTVRQVFLNTPVVP